MVNMDGWRTVIRQTVAGIADEAMQRRAWFGLGPEIDSPDETFCAFFGDAAFEEFLQRDDTDWSDTQLEAGRRLLELMQRLSDETPEHIEPADLIDDPRWINIREAAAHLSALLSTPHS